MAAVNQSIMEQLAKMEQSMTEQMAVMGEMRRTLGLEPLMVGQSSGKKGKKAKAEKAEKAEEAEAKPKKEPSDWNRFYLQTVAEMKEHGWESWTDLKGKFWPASKSGVKITVKDKNGVESESCVFDGGEHDGKPPSPSLGGMVRASYLNSLTSPEKKAKSLAYHLKVAEKKSQSSSVGSGAAEEPVADAPGAGVPKKGGRPKMTEEQKAAAKLKRDAKKAAAAVPVVLQEPVFEEDEAQTPTLMVGGGSTPAPKKLGKKVKAPLDLNFRRWTYEGESYYKNERGDVLSSEREWVGRFNGSEIDEAVPEADDLEEATVEDEIDE